MTPAGDFSNILPLIMFVAKRIKNNEAGIKIASVVSSMASVASHRPVAAASPKAKGTPKRLPSQRAPPRMSSSIARPKPPKSEDLVEELRHPAANLSSSGTGLGIETAATATPEDGSEASEAAAPIPPPPPPKSCLKHTDLTTALLSAMAPAKSVVWGDLPRGEGAHSKWSEGGRRWIKAKYVQKSRKGSPGPKKDKAGATPRYAMTEVERAEEKLAKIMARDSARAERAALGGDAAPGTPGTPGRAGARARSRSPARRSAAKGGSNGGSQSDRAVESAASAKAEVVAEERLVATERGRTLPALNKRGGSGRSHTPSDDELGIGDAAGSSVGAGVISSGSSGSGSSSDGSGGGDAAVSSSGDGAISGVESSPTGASRAGTSSVDAPTTTTPVPNRAEDAAQAAVREVTDAAMADAAQTATLKANVFSMLFGAQQQQQDPTDEAGQSEAAVHVTPAVIIDAKQMMAVVEVTDAGASGDGDHHAHQEASTGSPPGAEDASAGHAMMEEAPKKTGSEEATPDLPVEVAGGAAEPHEDSSAAAAADKEVARALSEGGALEALTAGPTAVPPTPSGKRVPRKASISGRSSAPPAVRTGSPFVRAGSPMNRGERSASARVASPTSGRGGPRLGSPKVGTPTRKGAMGPVGVAARPRVAVASAR